MAQRGFDVVFNPVPESQGGRQQPIDDPTYTPAAEDLLTSVPEFDEYLDSWQDLNRFAQEYNIDPSNPDIENRAVMREFWDKKRRTMNLAHKLKEAKQAITDQLNRAQAGFEVPDTEGLPDYMETRRALNPLNMDKLVINANQSIQTLSNSGDKQAATRQYKKNLQALETFRIQLKEQGGDPNMADQMVDERIAQLTEPYSNKYKAWELSLRQAQNKAGAKNELTSLAEWYLQFAAGVVTGDPSVYDNDGTATGMQYKIGSMEPSEVEMLMNPKAKPKDRFITGFTFKDGVARYTTNESQSINQATGATIPVLGGFQVSAGEELPPEQAWTRLLEPMIRNQYGDKYTVDLLAEIERVAVDKYGMDISGGNFDPWAVLNSKKAQGGGQQSGGYLEVKSISGGVVTAVDENGKEYQFDHKKYPNAKVGKRYATK